jgi:soluble cytochrome b562
MKKPSLSAFAGLLLICTLLAAATPCRAQGDEPKTPLSKEMGGIQRDFRSLRKALSDPTQKDAAVALVKDMEAHATKAKGFDPSKTKDIPAADKDQFLVDYHKQMDGLITDLQSLEAAVSAGNTADATALLNKIQGDKREGHKKFNAQDDRGPGQWRGGPGGNPPPPSGDQPPAAPMQSGS